jgi:hypothetical protein
VVAIVALPIVIFIGIIIGTALRDDDSAEEDHVTLLDGELEGTEWKVDAVTDVDGQTCVFLYEGDADDPLNGTCDLQPQDVTYGDQTVVFGRAETVEIDTTTADGMDGRFYAQVVDGDVDAESLAP